MSDRFIVCPDCGREALPNAIFVGCVNTRCRNFSYDVLREMLEEEKKEKAIEFTLETFDDEEEITQPYIQDWRIIDHD